MVYHVIFRPEEGADLFGGSDELLGSLPLICHFVDVGEAVIVL